jgi:EAL domain
MLLFCLLAGFPLQRDLYLQISGAKLMARRNHLLVEALRGERAAVEQTNLLLVEANVELSHRATRDPLTGLVNRALFSEHLTGTGDGLERGLLAAILELASHRDLSVTATGVQTKEEVAALRVAGVALVQGEAVSPPLSADDWLQPGPGSRATVELPVLGLRDPDLADPARRRPVRAGCPSRPGRRARVPR